MSRYYRIHIVIKGVLITDNRSHYAWLSNQMGFLSPVSLARPFNNCKQLFKGPSLTGQGFCTTLLYSPLQPTSLSHQPIILLIKLLLNQN